MKAQDFAEYLQNSLVETSRNGLARLGLIYLGVFAAGSALTDSLLIGLASGGLAYALFQAYTFSWGYIKYKFIYKIRVKSAETIDKD